MAGEYVTVEQMCKDLGGISPQTVMRMINRGELPPFDIGRSSSHVKGWHRAVLRLHAIKRYRQFTETQGPGFGFNLTESRHAKNKQTGET